MASMVFDGSTNGVLHARNYHHGADYELRPCPSFKSTPAYKSKKFRKLNKLEPDRVQTAGHAHFLLAGCGV